MDAVRSTGARRRDPHPVGKWRLDVGDTVFSELDGTETEIADVDVSAPIVEVDADGVVGEIELPDGTTQPLDDYSTALFCTSAACPDCPDFGELPVYAGSHLEFAAATVDQLTAGTQPRHIAPVLIGLDSCPPKPPKTSPTPTPDSSPHPGGGQGKSTPCSGSHWEGATGCDPAGPGPCSGSGACAIAWGDPHLITLDHASYDFQGVGEFVAARDRAAGIELQLRQCPLGTARLIAVTCAVAMDVAGVRVEVRPAPGGDLRTLLRRSVWTGRHADLGHGARVDLGHDAAASPDVVITSPDQTRAWVTVNADALAVPATVRNGRPCHARTIRQRGQKPG